MVHCVANFLNVVVLKERQVCLDNSRAGLHNMMAFTVSTSTLYFPGEQYRRPNMMAFTVSTSTLYFPGEQYRRPNMMAFTVSTSTLYFPGEQYRRRWEV